MSESSSDTDDDVPSGFTSDSYSDDGSVYASLSWPSWTAFCRSLGLPSVQWFANIGIIRLGKLYGTITFESDRVVFACSIGPIVQTIGVTYQDAIDCDAPVVIERQPQTIKFVGSIGQYRKLRRRLSFFVFDGLVPLANQVPFDADTHAKIGSTMDESDADGESVDRSKSKSRSKKSRSQPVASGSASKRPLPAISGSGSSRRSK